MMFAHLPAGYVVSCACLRSLRPAPDHAGRLLALGLFASIAPDLDVLYHYTVDQRAHSHHTYWTHTLAFWCVATVALWLFARVCRAPLAGPGAVMVGAGFTTHMALDTVTGSIRWLHPFDHGTWPLVVVPARFEGFWYLNYLLHWTFLVELTFVGAAVWLWRHRRSHPERHGFGGETVPMAPLGSHGARMG